MCVVDEQWNCTSQVGLINVLSWGKAVNAAWINMSLPFLSSYKYADMWYCITRNSTERTGFTYRLVLQDQMIVKVKFVVVHLFVPSLHMRVVYYWLMWQYFSGVNLLCCHTKRHKRELQLAKWLQLCNFLTFELLGIAGRIIMESQSTLAWKGASRGPAAQLCEGSANQVSLSNPEHLPQWRSHSLFARNLAVSLGILSMGSEGLFDKKRHHTQCAVLSGEHLKGTYLLGPLPEGICPPLLHGNMRPEEPTTWGFSPRISF